MTVITIVIRRGQCVGEWPTFPGFSISSDVGTNSSATGQFGWEWPVFPTITNSTITAANHIQQHGQFAWEWPAFPGSSIHLRDLIHTRQLSGQFAGEWPTFPRETIIHHSSTIGVLRGQSEGEWPTFPMFVVFFIMRCESATLDGFTTESNTLAACRLATFGKRHGITTTKQRCNFEANDFFRRNVLENGCWVNHP